MAAVGTQENPLRVAIIGSGPSGFYTVSNLLKQSDLVVEMDMFDRLPTPYGLVRAGECGEQGYTSSFESQLNRRSLGEAVTLIVFVKH